MKCACIIEIDKQIKEEIQSTLSQIDSQLKVFTFSNLEEFHKFTLGLIEKMKDTSNKSNSEKIELKLVIGDIAFLGPSYFTLVEKIKNLFIRRGFCTEQDPTQIILTAFNSPNLDHRQIESKVINNVIFKPFDKAILKQHLAVALNGHKIVRESSVFKQKVTATAEMLKEVPLIEFSELGFKTKSNRFIPPNNISKYYGNHFSPNGKSSVFARCKKCEPNPNNPNEYFASFEYYDLSNDKSKFLRQSLFKDHDIEIPSNLKNEKPPSSASKNTSPTKEMYSLVMITEPNNKSELELQEILNSRFSNVITFVFDDVEKFFEYFKNSITFINAIFVSQSFISKENTEKWKEALNKLRQNNLKIKTKDFDLHFITLNNKEFSEKEKRSYCDFIYDTIHTPIDRIYLYKRAIQWFPNIVSRQEEIVINHKSTNEVFSVANPVDLVEVSEAGLSIKYYREISYSSFRRFRLNRINAGDEGLELLASCYSYETASGTTVNHFVFFGITDHYLKFIRKWILDCHIVTKQSA